MYVLIALTLLQSLSLTVHPKHPIVEQSRSNSAKNTSTKNGQSELPPTQSQDTGTPSAPQTTPNKPDEEKKTIDRIYKVDVISPSPKPLDTPLFPVYLLLTGIGVFANLLIACLIYRQSRLMRHQVSTGHIATKAAIRSALAAKDSADAAAKTARALISSEAAAIMVRIHLLEIKDIPISTGNRTVIRFNYMCNNLGRTAAWITEKRFGLEIVSSVPDEPDLESIGSLTKEPESLDAHQESRPEFPWECYGHREQGKFALIWGVVKYEDVFGEHRESRFGYTVKVNRQPERIASPAYNKRT